MPLLASGHFQRSILITPAAYLSGEVGFLRTKKPTVSSGEVLQS